MRIVSWNVKGLSDPVKARAIANWLQSQSSEPDILCLLEVKASGSRLWGNLKSVDNQRYWVGLGGINGKGGVVMGFKN